MAISRAKSNFPIHWNVWHNDYEELDDILKSKQHNVEMADPRGRTPLHLAVTLGHMESARVLLRHGANANAENSKYWTVVQEAVATGDPELLQLVLQYRDYQRYTTRTEGIPALLHRLKEAPDFYVEMKWEFTSWLPLVSKLCPSDTYKVYKKGASVRIDTTLLGFDQMNWQRGNRSYVFTGQEDCAVVMEIDHDTRQVYSETIRMSTEAPDIAYLTPTEDQVAARLTSPTQTTYIDTEKISFERSKSGVWGWRSDKAETVNGHDCKVFGASNVELVTKQRVEHMTDQDRKTSKKSNGRNPLESFLGIAEKEHHKAVVEGATASNGEVSNISFNPSCITPEEYFDEIVDLTDRDIGRPIEQTTKIQKFKAQLWLCEEYPLSLPEQVIPIIDLMAVSNAHFKKLKDFITLQLPAGFPVKIEIPLFHVLNARITFGNIFALDKSVPSVTNTTEDERPVCVIDDAIFVTPADYSVTGSVGAEPMHAARLRDEDDQILQFAIQQSLLEAGTENDQVTVWEALNKNKQAPDGVSARYLKSEEERQFQRALEASMLDNPGVTPPVLPPLEPLPPRTDPLPPVPSQMDSDLQMALELSRLEDQDEERRKKRAEERQQQEDDELQQILALSLTEK